MLTFVMASATGVLIAPIVQLTPQDYPQEALRRQVSAAAVVKVVVAPNGKATSCQTGEVIGDKRLGRAICAIILSKRHRAAGLRDGTPTWGVLIDIMRFYVPDSPMAEFVAGSSREPMATFTVNRLPGNASRAVVEANVLIDDTGKATDCGPSLHQKMTGLVQAVCNNLPPLGSERVMNEIGQPISYVINYKVEFVAAGRPASKP